MTGNQHQQSKYRAQSARDAQRMGYRESYCDYLENSAYESHGYFRAKHDWANADLMFSRSLAEALRGNEGD